MIFSRALLALATTASVLVAAIPNPEPVAAPAPAPESGVELKKVTSFIQTRASNDIYTSLA